MVEKLVKKYGDEFMEKVWDKIPDSEYGNLETMVLYSLVRETKPKCVFEIGTERNGRSTHVIHRALMENGDYDLHIMADMEGWVRQAVSNLSKAMELDYDKIQMLSGLIQNTYTQADIGDVDFMFIDADHVREFAKFYLDNIIPKLDKGTWVHIHDVNLSGDWVWRPTPNSEVEEFLARREDGTFPLKKEFWLEDWCVHPQYRERREELNELYNIIGSYPAYELPYSSSASYWRVK